jgi:hypothetical protein
MRKLGSPIFSTVKPKRSPVGWHAPQDDARILIVGLNKAANTLAQLVHHATAAERRKARLIRPVPVAHAEKSFAAVLAGPSASKGTRLNATQTQEVNNSIAASLLALVAMQQRYERFVRAVDVQPSPQVVSAINRARATLAPMLGAATQEHMRFESAAVPANVIMERCIGEIIAGAVLAIQQAVVAYVLRSQPERVRLGFHLPIHHPIMDLGGGLEYAPPTAVTVFPGRKALISFPSEVAAVVTAPSAHALVQALVFSVHWPTAQSLLSATSPLPPLLHERTDSGIHPGALAGIKTSLAPLLLTTTALLRHLGSAWAAVRGKGALLVALPASFAAVAIQVCTRICLRCTKQWQCNSVFLLHRAGLLWKSIRLLTHKQDIATEFTQHCWMRGTQTR